MPRSGISACARAARPSRRGKGGATIGALEYPNVYYVDPRHPAAADEPAWGYPAVPLATLAKAMEVAQAGRDRGLARRRLSRDAEARQR